MSDAAHHPNLTVEIEPGQITVVRPVGTLDADTALSMEEAVARILDHYVTRLVIDGEGLEYLSSDGLRGFLPFVALCRARGGDLKMARFHGKASTIVELLGLDQIVQAFETVEAAVAAFREPVPSSFTAETVFLATTNGKNVHRPGCRFIRAKSVFQLRYFLEMEAAEAAGLSACSFCRPDRKAP